ncbi:ribosome maturation factor RimM [Porphyromonas sp. COT-290 OH860]|uniref:ribosome maturation factor RimM n=1 Tax=Porphyromonas sp. COT-290 OH860 TaxID=1515615 RepID=UPI00052C7472|nr:16S rRNA processing protein RimM [Porphyromonas sp. COT-290 OH860]KGN83489.1 16S rRNA processing protein RimM [Porphyromonas sp. COT-290 OH860]
MLKKEDFECIGTLGRSHGLSGEITAKLSIDISNLIDDEEALFLMLEEHGLLIPFRVEGLRSKAGDIDIIKFSGLESKEAAERWVNTPVWLDKAYLSEAEDVTDLLEYAHFVGYNLLDAESNLLIGTITEVDETTINTLITVERTTGEELILPIADELLAGIDVVQRTISLIIPAGLLDDSAEYDID